MVETSAVETSAQKRMAEDETAAMATETLGQSEQPALKKMKSEPEDAPASLQPVSSQPTASQQPSSKPAATDAGMTGTTNEIHQAAAAGVKQEVVQHAEGSQEEVKAEGSQEEVKAEEASALTAIEPEPEEDPDPPQKLGFKTFMNGDAAFQYFYTLVHALRHEQDLNEYEYTVVLALVKQGHPEPDTKIGSGVRAIQVRPHEKMQSTCFYLLRTDGTADNFSLRKCIIKLFPKWGRKHQRQPNEFMPKGGGRGGKSSAGRGGGARSSGSRGGRGGRRGRGRARPPTTF